MIELLTLLLEFLRAVALYKATIVIPLNTSLAALLTGFNYTLSQYSISSCNIQIANVLPPYNISRGSIEIFVSPSYLSSLKEEFRSFLQRAVNNYVTITLIKLECKDYPHLHDPEVKQFLKSHVEAKYCYGWGPEALYCAEYGTGTLILDEPMGSVQLLLPLLKEEGPGGLLLLNLLLANGVLHSIPKANGIYVNGILYAYGNDIPTILWSSDFQRTVLALG